LRAKVKGGRQKMKEEVLKLQREPEVGRPKSEDGSPEIAGLKSFRKLYMYRKFTSDFGLPTPG